MSIIRSASPAAVALVALMATIAPRAAQAQSPVLTTFVVTSGADTVAVERYQRTGDSTIAGDLRMPRQGTRSRYVVHLRPDGTARSVDVVEDRRTFFSGTVAFDGGSGVQFRAAGRVAHGTPDSYPLVGTSIALIEQIVRATHPAVGTDSRVPVLNIRNRLQGTATVRRLSADSVEVTCDRCQRADSHQVLDFALSSSGNVITGRDSLQEWTIVRR